MKDKYISEKLTGIFRQTLDQPQLILKVDLSAANVNNWDSIRHMQLIANVENEFRIKFSLKEIMRFRTIGDLVKLIDEKLENVNEVTFTN